ncbi:MAG: hypothetical protein HY870_22950 [Chloroflexi bacterium]|nr:hypothetical protein [Chloroflexota bacterium]
MTPSTPPSLTPYRITYTRFFRQQLAGLPGHIKSLARQEIAALSITPRPRHSRELAGHPGRFRLWLGRDFRLVWHVDDEARIIELEYVGIKSPDLYEQLGLGRSID